jgi:hypothetical protein
MVLRIDDITTSFHSSIFMDKSCYNPAATYTVTTSQSLSSCPGGASYLHITFCFGVLSKVSGQGIVKCGEVSFLETLFIGG